MKVKVSEASGPVLDWMVAKALGYTTSDLDLLYDFKSYDKFQPSVEWALGGPIIEREKICPCPASTANGAPWSATDLSGHVTQFGPTGDLFMEVA